MASASIGQDILLHAGLRWDESGVHFCAERGYEPERSLLPFGAIIAVARVTAAIPAEGAIVWPSPSEFSGAGFGPSAAQQAAKQEIVSSPWFFGPWGWGLSNVRALKSPVSCRGFQRLWRPGAAIINAVNAQL